MKNMKKFNRISLLALGTSALTLINLNPIEAQTTYDLNLRSGPSSRDSIILTIEKGSQVTVLKTLGEWSKIKFNKYIGYIPTKYIEILNFQDKSTTDENKYQPDKIKIMECKVDVLNVRFEPSSSNKILGTLRKGDKVEILYEVNDTWARIKHNDNYGYVEMEYLSEVNSDTISYEPTLMYCNTSTLNIRKGPSSRDSILGCLRKNDKVKVVEDLNNGWSKIEINNDFAYVSSQSLSYTSSQEPHLHNDTMKCNLDSLEVLNGPASSEKIIGILKKDDIVKVIYHVSTGWTKIKHSNGYGYVNTSNLL